MTAPTGFVRVRGTQFERGGQPFAIVGVNFWHAAYLGQPGPAGDRPRLGRELDQLAAAGITNLRILAASEPTPYSPLTPVFQPRPREYNETLLQGLDFALAELGRRNMTAVLYLHDQWEWSGGMATYVEWVTGERRPTATAWPDTVRFDARFFALPEARALHRDYIRHVVARRNTVTARPYADDPAIMAWQLANEPRAGDAGDVPRYGPALLGWARETASLLRELAPHQLVSSGSEGVESCDQDRGFYRDLHALPGIDYCTIHLWPLNWKWYRPADHDATFAPALARAEAYLDLHLDVAREIRKPLVLEEFGLPRDGGAFTPGSPTSARDELVGRMARRLRESCRTGDALAGINFWSWSGEAVPADPRGAPWRPGLPFGGDNPVEPQGLNALFSTDRSTLTLLNQASRAVRESAASSPLPA